MKKMLFVLLLFLSITVCSQIRTTVISVPDAVTTFKVAFPAGTQVCQEDIGVIYELTAYTVGTKTLTTATKRVLSSGPEVDPIWKADTANVPRLGTQNIFTKYNEFQGNNLFSDSATFQSKICLGTDLNGYRSSIYDDGTLQLWRTGVIKSSYVYVDTNYVGLYTQNYGITVNDTSSMISNPTPIQMTGDVLFNNKTVHLDSISLIGGSLQDSIYVYSDGNLHIDKYDGAGTNGTITGNGAWVLESNTTAITGALFQSSLSINAGETYMLAKKNYAGTEYRQNKLTSNINGFIFNTSTKTTSVDGLVGDTLGNVTVATELRSNRLNTNINDTMEFVDDAIFDSTVTVNGNFYAGNSTDDTTNVSGDIKIAGKTAVGATTYFHQLNINSNLATNLNSICIYDGDINKNTSSAAQQRDTAAFYIYKTLLGKTIFGAKSVLGANLFSMDSVGTWRIGGGTNVTSYVSTLNVTKSSTGGAIAAVYTGSSSSTAGGEIIIAQDDNVNTSVGDMFAKLTLKAARQAGGGLYAGAMIAAIAAETFANSKYGSNLYFYTVPINTASLLPEFIIYNSGIISQTYNLYESDSLKLQRESSSLADGGTITLATGQSGYGTLYVDSAGFRKILIYFSFQDDGTTWLDASYNTGSGWTTAATTDTPGNVCVYDAGAGVAIKINLNYRTGVRLNVNYATN